MNQQKDKQHFSDNHILKFQPEEGDEITCHACKFKVEEDESFYGCIDCKYFLHEFCSDAPRSVVHPSHPPHPLTLLATATCSNRAFKCNACGLIGDSFCFSCAHCAFDLHLICSLLPPTLSSFKEHPHELELVCEPEKLSLITANKIVVCLICDVVITHEYWLVYCSQCKVGIHLKCLFAKYVEENTEEEDTEEEEEGITENPELSDNEENLFFSPPSSPSSSSSSSSLSSGRKKEPNIRTKTRQELEEAILESLREMARIAHKLALDVFSAVADYVATSYRTRYGFR